MKPIATVSQRRALIAAAICGLTATAFFTTARTMLGGRLREFDRRVILSLRVEGDVSDPLGPRWVEELMRDMTALGGVGVITLVAGAATAFLWLAKRRGEAVFLAVSASSATLLSFLLKSLFDRPRPDFVPHGSYVYTKSFPSGHSMMAACVYLTLAAVAARVVDRTSLKLFFVALAASVTLAVGVSRVYLGVHWPTDVLAGWAAGAAWALACWLAERVLLPRPREITT